MVRPLIDGRDQGADRGVLQGHLNQGPPPVRGLREGGPSSSFPSSSRRSPAPSPPSSGAARGGRSSGRCWRWFSSGDGGGRDRCRANRIGQIERFSGDRRTCNHSHLRRRFLIYSPGRGRQVLFRYHAGPDQAGGVVPRKKPYQFIPIRAAPGSPSYGPPRPPSISRRSGSARGHGATFRRGAHGRCPTAASSRS